ncbi:hypothetical protein CDD81_603 [Ophiocordyceps australis]|uniref:WSC domain-containing protein n=1 Tax=Ophiocordyceps australis TaxID=1399860 RepID=A0A2C5XL10_9HYPO|nr:hypothetical protein CDD81_603 [Ophiocordyceps australis]
MASVLKRAPAAGSLLLMASVCAALDPSICASFNTATSMQPKNDIYQTNGLCHDYCISQNQAYAITQGNSCWCSNYTPAKSKQVDTGSCDKPCPAYPSEMCGGNGLFSYIALNASPAGVRPEESKPSPSSPPPPPPSPSETSTSSTPTPTPTDDANTSSSSSSSVERLPATSIVQTVTAGGTIRTVTVIPSPTDDVANSDSARSRNRDGDGGGGIGRGGVVGIVVGCIVGVLSVAGAIMFWWLRRKRIAEQEAAGDDPSLRGSSSGMIGGRPEMAPGSPGSTGNRSSMLNIDPRMDPFKQGLYARAGSHESVNTLRDEHDYSRRIHPAKVLRATNPDPVAGDDA